MVVCTPSPFSTRIRLPRPRIENTTIGMPLSRIRAIAELSPDQNGFGITYTIDEGAKYKFGKLTVVTDLKKLNPDILRQLLPIKTGQMYEDQKIESATDALTFAAGAAGFAFVDVRPEYHANRCV